MAMTIGQIIRRLRKERNLTQEELAEQLNITPQAVSRWENETGLPDISQVVPLANVFGVSVDVLFGTDGVNGDEEVEKFIQQMEIKSNNKPEGISSFAHRKECCEDIQKMLMTYPNNYKLLSRSLYNIVMLLWAYWDDRFTNEIPDKESQMKEWRNECIRQANIILTHCTEIEYLNQAHRWMVSMYRIMGDYAKAEEHAQKLSDQRGRQLAIVYDDTGRTEEAMKQFSSNIMAELFDLEQELPLLGYLYRKQGKYEEAYACYRLYPDIFEMMVGDGGTEIPYYTKPCYDWCAAVCMDLGRPDEAMDWLEKWIRHERIIAKNFNVITESKLPYFYGLDYKPYSKSYSRENVITSSLEWESFDPIRETERFKAIAADAKAFERGE